MLRWPLCEVFWARIQSILEPGFLSPDYSRGAGQICDAIEIYEGLVAEDESSPTVWKRLADLYDFEREPDRSRAAYARACELNREDALARFALGECLLRDGEWLRGWNLFDARLELKGFQKSPIFQKIRSVAQQWNFGSVPECLTIVAEQGFGDIVQFARYLTDPNINRSDVYFIASSSVHDLIRRTGTQVQMTTMEQYEVARTAEYWAPMMSLPRLLSRPDPAAEATYAYLGQVEANPHPVLKIGYVYKGNAEHENDADRSIAREAILSAIPKANCEAFSLQQGDLDNIFSPLCHRWQRVF